VVDNSDDDDNHYYKIYDEGKQKAGASIITKASAQNEKVKVAAVSIIASASLALLKVVVGLSTNSLGILSESLHSGLDTIAALMTLYAILMAIRPPDLSYTYGYAKIESIASLMEIILLFAVAGWIFYEGIERIFLKTIQPEITVYSFVIMFVSIAVDFGRSRSLYRTARKYGSHALEADALHFKTDMFSSAIVIVGLLLVFLLKIPNADAFAAIAVAGMIIYTSLGLGRRTLDVLLDKAPKGVNQQIVETVSGLEGVSRAHNLRVRNVGSETFVDMHIEVARTYSHDRAHRVATAVEEKVRETLPNSDVLVHVDATESSSETTIDRIRLIAAEIEGIRNVHSIYLSHIPSLSDEGREYGKEEQVPSAESEKKNLSHLQKITKLLSPLQLPSTSPPLHLYLDVQMGYSLDLNTAHKVIDNFEKRLKGEIPLIEKITTHIETESGERTAIGTEKKINQSYLEKIRNIALSFNRIVDCSDIGIVDNSGELHITFTVKLKRDPEKNTTSIEDAHKIATNIQNQIIKETGASRVIVHTEPA
jgi:cation diffusion facilitator family transporter